MKIQFHFTLVVICCCFLSFLTPVSAQETQIDGKSYETISKVYLNANADFVKLKQKSMVQ